MKNKLEILDNNEELLEEILRTAPVIGSGKDGIVLRIDADRVCRMNIADSEVAAKILKVYNPDKANKEYTFLSRAYELVKDNHQGYAKIVRPIYIKKQHLSEEDRLYLNRSGTFLGNDADIILMDFIQGKDITNYIYDFVLKNLGLDYMIDASLEDKFNVVANQLNFEFSSSDGKDDFADIIAQRDNTKKLIAFLHKNRFSLPEGTIEKIRNTVKLINENGIFHNDLSERNIILGDDGEVYIIDFGSSVNEKEDVLIDDMSIVNRLTEMVNFNKLQLDRDIQKNNLIKTWEKYCSTKEKHDKRVVSFVDKDNFISLKNLLQASVSDEGSLNKMLGTIIYIIKKSEKKDYHLNKITEIIKQIILETKFEYGKKILSNFLDYLQKI